MKIIPKQTSHHRFKDYAKAREGLAAELAEQSLYIEFLGNGSRVERVELEALETRAKRYSAAHRQNGKMNPGRLTAIFTKVVQRDNTIPDKEGEIALFQNFIVLNYDLREVALRALQERCAKYPEAHRGQAGSWIELARAEMIESHDALITETARCVANDAIYGYGRAHINALGRVLHEDLRPLREQHGLPGRLPDMTIVEPTRTDDAKLYLNNIESARKVLGRPLADKLFAECNRVDTAGGDAVASMTEALLPSEIRRAGIDAFSIRNRTDRRPTLAQEAARLI
jgi:hypothetical protein